MTNICIRICKYESKYLYSYLYLPFFVNPNIFILVFKKNVKSNHKMLYFLLLQIKYHKMYLWYHRGNLGTALLQQTIFWRFHLKPTKIIIHLAITRILLFSWHFIFHPYFVAFRKQAKFQYESISPLSEGKHNKWLNSSLLKPPQRTKKQCKYILCKEIFFSVWFYP